MKAAVGNLYEMGKTNSEGSIATHDLYTYSVTSSPITRSLTLVSAGNYIAYFSAGEGSNGSPMVVSDITASNGTATQLYKNATSVGDTWVHTYAVSIAFIKANDNCVISVTSTNRYTQAQTGAAAYFCAIRLS